MNKKDKAVVINSRESGWKVGYETQVKNKLYLCAFGEVVYSDHFLERMKQRNLRIPTIRTLIYGKVIEVALKKEEVTRAVISIKESEKRDKEFVVGFENDNSLIFITVYSRKRKGE